METSLISVRETAKDFLNAHRKAVFAILDKEGLPTTSLMLYAIDDDLRVYFGTRTSYGKYRDILKHPTVSLSVVEEATDPLRVVDIRGNAEEIHSDMLSGTRSFFKQKNPARYYIEDADDFTMFRITPDFVRWVDASTGSLVATDIIS